MRVVYYVQHTLAALENAQVNGAYACVRIHAHGRCVYYYLRVRMLVYVFVVVLPASGYYRNAFCVKLIKHGAYRGRCSAAAQHYRLSARNVNAVLFYHAHEAVCIRIVAVKAAVALPYDCVHAAYPFRNGRKRGAIGYYRLFIGNGNVYCVKRAALHECVKLRPWAFDKLVAVSAKAFVYGL